MKDIKCPYCNHPQDINHDDGYGYKEDITYEQECRSCGKIFIYTTEISFYYDVEAAPCKNNEVEHTWEDIKGYPEEFFKGKQRCKICDEERQL